MLENLLASPFDFIKWYFIDFPRKIFVVGRRFIVLINNEIAFTLNVRLLFTPLFGDYTKMGRLIGFVIRVLEIIFGLILILLVIVSALLVPILWFVVPLLILYHFKLAIILYFVIIFLIWFFSTKDIPRKRVKEIEGHDAPRAYRPRARADRNMIISSKKLEPSLLHKPEMALVLQKLELTSPEFLEKISSITIDTKEIDQKAYEYAQKQETRYIEPEHVFLAAVSVIPKIDNILAAYASSLKAVVDTVDWMVSERERVSKVLIWQDDYPMPKMGGIGKGMTGRVTPALDGVSEDFTKLAQKGRIRNIVAHKKEITEVTELLSSSNTNVMLIGPPGCGKTSVVRGIAVEIIRGTEEKSLQFKRIVTLDTGSLIAGAKTAGDIAERLKNIMEEAKASGDVIIFFDEIHNLVSGPHGGDASMIFSILQPHLQNFDIQFIGATNLDNYRKYIEPSGAFSKLFEVVEIPEASNEDTLAVLKVVSKDYEDKYQISISYPALATIIDLSAKLMHERVFPDKALDVLNRTAARVKKGTKYLTAAEVRKEISEMTHVPVTHLSEDESEKLLNLEDQLKERVIGQGHAISEIVKAMQRARVGIRDEEKPIASFLFVGTTGVGKTETAKALAEKYFGDEKSMIRIDMSEYQEQDSIKRLIGDPGGEKKGILTDAVRSRPFSLILLDEIEKAYSSVLLTFLQVLDDGRLTDASGITVDFSNSMIIATSNVGTRQLQQVAEKGGTIEEMTEEGMREVREHYAPEFLNRFDGIIVYKPLTHEVVTKIAGLQLNRVEKMADEKGIKVSFKRELIEGLVERGYSKQWGARELNRVISDYVETYLARLILKDEVKRGDEIELGAEVFGQVD